VDVLAIVLDILLEIFDKKVLLGVLLTVVPIGIWMYVNKTFVKRVKLENLNKSIDKINAEIKKLKEEVTIIEQSKVSKSELTDFLDNIKEEFKGIERKLTKVLGTVIHMTKNEGGSYEDIIRLIDES